LQHGQVHLVEAERIEVAGRVKHGAAVRLALQHDEVEGREPAGLHHGPADVDLHALERAQREPAEIVVGELADERTVDP